MMIHDRMISELADVQHAPTLNKNIISWSVPNKIWYNIVIGSSGVKMTYGYWVIGKEVWECMLYYLLRSIVTEKWSILEENKFKDLGANKLLHAR